MGASGIEPGDYVHFTGAGYRMIGDMLIEELMAQYNRFLAIRAEGFKWTIESESSPS
jgi:hypothetical protein